MSADPWTDDAQLAAYLAGDLDELTARRIEERLARDPEVAARLDELHDTLLALRQPDTIVPPDGLEDRVAARLEEEWAAAGADAPRRWYQRLVASPRSWQVPAGAAAAVVLVAVVASGLIVGSMGDEAADMATFDTMDAGSRERATPQEEVESDDEAAETFDADDLPGAPHADLDAQEDPILREDAAREADVRWEALPRRQSACREEVEEAAPGPAVPLRANEDHSAQPPVIVFEVATATQGQDILDEVVRVVVDAEGCEVVDVRP